MAIVALQPVISVLAAGASIERRQAGQAGTDLAFADYLGGRCAAIARELGATERIQIGCSVADGPLSAVTALGLAQIAEELITNAIRHGFSGGASGRIFVRFRAGVETLVLTVEDSGIAAGRRFGVARELSALLGGELELDNVLAGTRCAVTLPRQLKLHAMSVVDGQPAEKRIRYTVPEVPAMLQRQHESAR